MTPAKLQQLCAEGKRLAEQATPYGSNWRADGADVLSTENYVTARIVDFNRTIAMNSTKEEAECRANFIAFANPATILSLIQAIEELSAENTHELSRLITKLQSPEMVERIARAYCWSAEQRMFRLISISSCWCRESCEWPAPMPSDDIDDAQAVIAAIMKELGE